MSVTSPGQMRSLGSRLDARVMGVAARGERQREHEKGGAQQDLSHGKLLVLLTFNEKRHVARGRRALILSLCDPAGGYHLTGPSQNAFAGPRPWRCRAPRRKQRETPAV